MEHPERGHRAAPWNAGVPAADGEALGPAYYFEHHVKLLLAPGAEPGAEPGAAPGLAEVVRPHAAHVSRNARRVRADGRAERFVTRRCRRVGARTAGARLDALTGALRARGTVQVDSSFGERLPVEPDVVLVPVPDGPDALGEPREVPLRCATPALSLAWKVHWLLSEYAPQPKDLYDAWLLAGHVGLDTGLVDGLTPRRLEGIGLLRLDPEEFENACPQADGPPARYVRELAERLADPRAPRP
ncbi:nucleotidyl transferase AbiEii/AbiGii toxin family protein [Spirillospora sp. NPDC052242]